jgi:hypothetical protein
VNKERGQAAGRDLDGQIIGPMGRSGLDDNDRKREEEGGKEGLREWKVIIGSEESRRQAHRDSQDGQAPFYRSLCGLDFSQAEHPVAVTAEPDADRLGHGIGCSADEIAHDRAGSEKPVGEEAAQGGGQIGDEDEITAAGRVFFPGQGLKKEIPIPGLDDQDHVNSHAQAEDVDRRHSSPKLKSDSREENQEMKKLTGVACRPAGAALECPAQDPAPQDGRRRHSRRDQDAGKRGDQAQTDARRTKSKFLFLC